MKRFFSRTASALLSVLLLISVFAVNVSAEGGASGAAGTFTLVGDTAHGDSGHTAYSVWLQDVPFTIEEGDTALEVFKEILTENGYAYEGDPYISAITTPGGCRLASGTNGSASGWMYYVNGEMASVGADQYVLQAGDQLLWMYVDNWADDSRVEGDQVVADTDVVLPSYTSSWNSFRGNENNIAVYQGNTPLTQDQAQKAWSFALKQPSEWSKNVSDPIFVNGNMYVAVGSELLVLDAKGNCLKRVPLAASIEFTCRPVYGDGRILVPLPGGRVQALAADTLQTLWVTEELPLYTAAGGTEYTHQTMASLTYKDGYVYLGTACADFVTSYGGTYLCIEASTGTTVWKYENTQAGYYWGGAVCVGDALVFAGDDGKLVSLNAKTGAKIAELDLGAGCRSTTVYEGGNVYVTTLDGAVHKVAMQADGSFGAHAQASFGAYSTCTPAVYGGKIYVGGSDANYKGVFAILDSESLKVLQSYEAPADVKSAPLVAVQEDGTVAAYFTSNTRPGALYAVEAGKEGVSVVFTPEEALQNYCMASVSAGPDGTLYYTNDSGSLFAISMVEEEPESSSSGSGTESSSSSQSSESGSSGTGSESSSQNGENFPTGESSWSMAAFVLLTVSLAGGLLCLRKSEKTA